MNDYQLINSKSFIIWLAVGGFYLCYIIYSGFDLFFLIPNQIAKQQEVIYFRGIDIPLGVSLALILTPLPWEELTRVLKFTVILVASVIFLFLCSPLNHAYIEMVGLSDKYRLCQSISRRWGSTQVWGRPDLNCQMSVKR